MTRTKAAGAIAIAIGLWMLLGGAMAAQPRHLYFETAFVAVAPALDEDFGVVSAWEDSVALGFSGLFIDYNTVGIARGATNTAAAVDTNGNFWNWLHPSGLWDPIFPTGHLAVAKTFAVAPPAIDFYGVWNGDLNWHLSQYLAFNGPQQPTWTIPTASGSPVMAMEVANGFPVRGSVPQLFLTDYLITAETIGGNIAFGAYGLTDIWGNVVQPTLVSGTVTTISGTVLGMAISNGTVNPGTQERTLNEIVLVVQNPPVNGPLTVHSITFDTRTALFGWINIGTAYGTPYNLTTMPVPGFPNGTGTTILGGLSIARNNASAMGGGFSHDIAISTANAANPGGAAGATFIFLPTGAQPTPLVGVGGGPICHIPGSDVLPGPPSQYIGVAWAAFGFPAIGGQPFPFGWYLVTPGNPYTIQALHATGALGANFSYSYPVGATPNGPPMSHPGAMALLGNPALRAGTLWIPYFQAGGASIDFIEGQGTWIGPVAPVTFAVPTNNFPTLPGPIPPWPNAPPAVLPRGNTVWPANAILRGVAFLSEYGLYLQGY